MTDDIDRSHHDHEELVNKLAKRLYEMGHEEKWDDISAGERELGKLFVRYMFNNNAGEISEMLARLSQ